MPAYTGNALKVPKINWGTSSGSFANTLTFAFPLDNPVPPWSEPREGSVTAQVESGESDAWIVGFDYYVAGTVTGIPGVDAGGITGWDGSAGWDAFLRTASGQMPFRYFPDAASGTYYTCYLIEPFGSTNVYRMDGTRDVQIKIKNISGPFTGY